jgi:hypothetical protein
MWKAHYSLSDRLYGAFHISEGTDFKLNNLSLEYLQWISHFISFCLYLYREAERKITAAFYVGNGLFSDPSPIQNIHTSLLSVPCKSSNDFNLN